MRSGSPLAVLLLLLPAGEARAWDVEGHVLIAKIAEDAVSREARREIQSVLGARLSDPKVAAWADDVRSSRPETKPWHYVNVPVRAAGYEKERDCPTGECVTERILPLLETWANKKLPKRERAEALMMLAHLVGDLHQPLHVGDKEDRGGNRIEVHIAGTGTVTDNLHAIWDTGVVTATRGRRTPEAFVAWLRQRYPDTCAEPTDAAALVRWTSETHFAAQDLYRELPRTEGVKQLAAGYLGQQQLRAEQQLIRAGIRLAGMLEQVRGKTVPCRGKKRAPDAPKNLMLLAGDDPKRLRAGMELLTKGLGVKCSACHVEGRYEKEDVREKAAGRSFLAATLGNDDTARRQAALAALLSALKLRAVADEAKIWEAVDVLPRHRP